MNKKRLLILLLSILIITALVVTLAACSGKESEEEQDTDVDNPTVKTLTSTQALAKIHSGLISGGESVKTAAQYGVETEYSVYTNMLNYTVTYKANYQENYADSEIYLNVFDNYTHLDRLCFYYDGKDLYYRSGENRQVISNFGTTMMYNVFYEMCRRIDATEGFFSNKIGTIFDANSAQNISLILGSSNIRYNYAGENKEVIELFGLDLSATNGQVNLFVENFFRGVDDKFDLITNEMFGFKLSRIAQMRFLSIYADSLEFRFDQSVAKYQSWTVNGTLQDSSKYNLNAVLNFNDGRTRLSEGNGFIKARYTEANIGKNHFLGTVLIPSVSDEEFDADLITNISAANNALNEASLRIFDAVGTDFISGYYKGEYAFINASGFYNWLDGAIDLDAFNLPKLYFDNLDLTKLINAGYNDIVKVLIVMFSRGSAGEVMDKETYQMLIDNFHNDGVSYVYYTFTEEWYHRISGDETPLMDKVAEKLGVDSAQLASYIGEDFFTDAELEVGYDLNTKKIIVKLYQHGEMLMRMTLVRDEYYGVSYPSDVFIGSSSYAKINIPTVATLEFDTELAVRNGKTSTDVSHFFGTMVGDVSGKNTHIVLDNTEVLIARGTISEDYVVNSQGETVIDNMISINIYLRKNKDMVEKLALAINTNPDNKEELLIGYYLPIGDYANESGLFYRISKSVVKAGFSELLGEDNIFSDGSVLNILNSLITSDGVTTISKLGGWFSFSLVVSQDADPVYDLIGIKDTTATIKARILFVDVDREINTAPYVKPVITPLDSITVNSIYSEGSAWKDSVEVIINSSIIHMVPNYTEESTTVITDKKVYTPTAYLFGERVAYNLNIVDTTGTYRVDRLASAVIILDPAYTKKLPSSIEVVYDNGFKGSLPCEIMGFDESNITLAGYNLKGFAGEFDDNMISKIVIGKDSILNVTFDAYILVNNRQVIPATDSGKNAMFDDSGVPVVGVIKIDPYSYAMRKINEADYDPIRAGMIEQNMQLIYNGVYGEEEVPDGDDIKVVELSYDVLGYNRFNLSELNLTWEYDEDRISWQGDDGYAYATYGDNNGYSFRIAIRVIVSAQHVDYVKIDDEVRGTYTIDFLQKDTYAIPTQSGTNHTVTIYFSGSDTINEKHRIVSLSKPENVSDQDYYDNYIYVSLNWDRADEINRNNYLITATTDNYFYTEATFGSALGVGTQTVSIRVEIPDRTATYMSTGSRMAVLCELDANNDPVFTEANVSPSMAYFLPYDGKTYTYGEGLEINPYDSAFRLPSTICMEVNAVSGYHPVRTVKEYAVNWVTTDNNGHELNLIVQKDDGGFALAHPVTKRQNIVVYGKVGDRGDEEDNDQNLGYIWVVMVLCNLESNLRSIVYAGLDAGIDTIHIDPYLPYTLPTGFTAVLDSGKIIERENIEWYAKTIISGETYWYPINYHAGFRAEDYDEYYYNGKYVFDRRGGSTAIRYIIEAEEDSIRQEVVLNVEVSPRTIIADRIDVYGNGSQPSRGYSDINYYEAPSYTLYNRLTALRNNTDLTTSVTFTETASSGTYTMYELVVSWDMDGASEHSLLHLIEMLETSESAGGSMTLQGVIYAGTINEQTLSVSFSFVDRTISALNLSRIAYGQEKSAVRVVDVSEVETSFPNNWTSIDRSNNRTVALSDVKSGSLNIKLDKPYALTIPDANNVERYATPYQYINYILGAVVANFNGGIDATVRPELKFDVTEDAFNRSVLIFEGDISLMTIRLLRVSEGSALDEIVVNIYAINDTRIDDSAELTLELFDANGAELYSTGSPYYLPTRFTINYEYSGAVIYDMTSWEIEGTSAIKELFNKYDNTTVTQEGNIKHYFTGTIDVKLLNTLRLGGDSDNQAATYNFSYTIPCVNERFYLALNVPKKNVMATNYNATGDTDLYDINNGILEIDNPYLYYDPDVEVNEKKYGLDVTKIPNVITPIVGSEYWTTEINSYEIAWEFREGVFNPDYFAAGRTGSDNKGVLFATAKLNAYYDETGKAQQQTIELYLKLNALNFDGITYGRLPVVKESDLPADFREDSALFDTGSTEPYVFPSTKDVIRIDPYDDVMGYGGKFTLPTNGLLISFNGGAATYTFNGVIFRLCNKDGVEYDESISTITEIEYDAKGHKLTNSGLDPNVVVVNMYIPGFGLPKVEIQEEGEPVAYSQSGTPIRLYIYFMSREVDEALMPNMSYNALGVSQNNTYNLPSLYYIDPYNNATFALPSSATIKFEGYNDYDDINISGWAVYDESTQKMVDLPTSANGNRFYSRASDNDSAQKYGFFHPLAEDYAGGIFTLYGYLSMERKVSGTVSMISKQYFPVTVIVLNRSLQMTYSTTYRYDDPFGGVLADIGGELTQEMFVAYDNYYEKTLTDGQMKYSEFSTPILPTINWSANNDESIIDYFGGFNIEVVGNVYSDNRHRAEEYLYAESDFTGKYTELAKARMWDAYFGENGAPLANYSSNTIRKLTVLSETLEREVIYSTYLLLVDKYQASSDETEKQYGSYLANGLINEVTADTEYDRRTQILLITEELFARLKARYLEDVSKGVTTERGTIYSAWKTIYDQFVAAGSDTDVNMSAYQVLKAAKYDEANDATARAFTVTEVEVINTPIWNRINRNLTPYKNASIWDELYDKALYNERARMDSLLSVATVANKSLALRAYLAETLSSLGSAGEAVYASVSAPSLSIGNIKDGGSNISEFLFNIYSRVSFLTGIDVDVILNYSEIFDPYIEEGLRLAYDEYRNETATQKSALTEYVARRTAEIVNAIVPTRVIPNSGGQTEPIIAFTYETYSANSASNAGYWNSLYNAQLDKYNNFVSRITGESAEDKWNYAYASHRIAEQEDVLTAMDLALAEANNSYDAAYAVYIDVILYNYFMAELDSYYNEAILDADVVMANAIYEGNVSELLYGNGGEYSDYRPAFSDLYDDIAKEVLDRLQNSFNSVAMSSYYDMVVSYRSNPAIISAGNLTNEAKQHGEVLYFLLRDNSVDNTIKARATYIFNWKLGGEAAYETLLASPQTVGYTAAEVQALLAAATVSEADTYAFLDPNDYNVTDEENVTYAEAGAGFTAEEYESFAKSVLFERLLDGTLNLDYKNTMRGWFNSAIREHKAAAFEQFLLGLGETLRHDLEVKRNNDGQVMRTAFNYYVAARKAMGDAIQTEISADYASIYARAEMDESENIVSYLTDPNNGFAYASCLVPTSEEAVQYRREAIEYYRDNFANSKELYAISMHLSLDGNDAMSSLTNRLDLGEAFVKSINNAYYYIILRHAESKIKAIVRSGLVESNYSTLYDTYRQLFSDVVGDDNGNIDIWQEDYVEECAILSYLESAYATIMSYRTTTVAAIRTATESRATSEIYYKIYKDNAELLDEILYDYYVDLAANPYTQNNARLKKKAYLQLQQLMIDSRLNNYYNVVEEVVDIIVKSELYDQIGNYALTDGENATAFLNSLIDAYDDVVEGLNAEQKAEMDAVVLPSVFTIQEGDTTESKLTSILETYLALYYDTGVLPESVQTLLDELYYAGLDYISDELFSNNTECVTALTFMLFYATCQDNYSGIIAGTVVDDEALYVRLAVKAALLFKRIDTLRSNGGVDPTFMSTENLAGDFTVVSDEYKRAYIDLLIEVFGTYCIPAHDYLVNYVADNAIDWYAMTDADPDYADIEDMILAKLSLTSMGSVIDSESTINQLVTNVTGEISLYLQPYLNNASGDNDTEYAKVFQAMHEASGSVVRFYTADNIPEGNEERVRHEVVFDKSGFDDSGDTEITASIYLNNGYKGNNTGYRIDGIKYVLATIDPRYVDYNGATAFVEVSSETDGAVTTTSGTFYAADRVVFSDGFNAIVITDNAYTKTSAVNSMTIDPMAPSLPVTVKTYGVYSRTGSEDRLYDLGEVQVTYNEVFYENIYEGHAVDSTSYTVTLIDSKAHEYNSSIAVTYRNRTISQIYFETATYDDDALRVGGDGAYQNYYTLYDEASETNRIKVDPINEDILDMSNKRYILPSQMAVRFVDGEEELYRNIVWDMSGIEYSLAGQSDILMRIISFSVDSEEGERRVTFDYAHNTMNIGLYDDEENLIGSVRTFNNVPSYSVWNIKLDVIDQTVSTLEVRVSAETTDFLGRYSAEGRYVDAGLAESGDIADAPLYTINPFDIRYPENIAMSFAGGSQIDLKITDWGLEEGDKGVYKIADIIKGTALDNYVIATFTYLNYIVRVRFLTDDIKIELTDGEPIDGGTIYLVMGGGSASQQLAKNYSYLYYNFSTSGGNDFRRVSLSFIDSYTDTISTEAEAVYDPVYGVLGWDKVAYPNMTLMNNIKFRVQIVNPKFSAILDGNPTSYVIKNYISEPHDTNYRRANYSDEPSGTGISYFISYGRERSDDLYFNVDPSATVYDVLNGKVTYQCLFDLSSGYLVAADELGGKQYSFAVTLPLKTYLYNEVSNATLDPTPVKDAANRNIWTWASNDEYGDAINWTLGRSMSASDLPKVIYYVDGVKREIDVKWNLDGVNVNKATEGGEGYAVYGYYYDANGIWVEKELHINIAKEIKSDEVMQTVSDAMHLMFPRMNLEMVYNGSYYHLPLDLDAEDMQFLRPDGTQGSLNEDDVIIEYKLASDDDREYSTDKYPLNAGVYSIRVIINDYNVKLPDDFIFTLTISPYEVNVNQITFENQDDSGNSVSYEYDGELKNLTVATGLPLVTVDNWFSTREEKEALLAEHTSVGYTDKEAKSRAYSALYRRVTPATKRYLDNYVRSIAAETGYTGDYLYAAVFDRLEENLKIVEAIYSVQYVQGNTQLTGAPSDVGTYSATFTINAEDNSGNYVYSSGNGMVRKTLIITMPDIDYAPMTTTLTYNAGLQNPRISGLHTVSGELPSGVEVIYTYSYVEGGEQKERVGGVVDVGVYSCTVQIYGGNNYPSCGVDLDGDGEVEKAPLTFSVAVEARDLFIGLDNVGSEYLQELADLQKALIFEGLADGDNKSSFGYVDIVTAAKDYYSLGFYPITINGMRISEEAEGLFTYDVEGDPIIHGGMSYKQIALKDISDPDSLMRAEQNVYGTAIKLFSNYNVYVVDSAQYEIRTISEYDTAYEVVTNATELSEAIALAADGDRVSIYLTADDDGEGDLIETDYGDVVIDVEGTVVIYGSNNHAREVVTFFKSLRIVNGSVELHVMGFRAQAAGHVGILVGSNASDVFIYDSVFLGNGYSDTVGIKTGDDYDNRLVITRCDFRHYRRAIELISGNLELSESEFNNNNVALSIESNGTSFMVEGNVFAGNERGVYIGSSYTTIRYNSFVRNTVAILLKDELGNMENFRKENLVARNSSTDGRFVFEDNVVDVSTVSNLTL